MVVLEPGRSNERLLAFAADLAIRMGINLTGAAACQPMAAVYDQTMILENFIQEDRDELDAEVKAVKAECDAALTRKGIDLSWHSTVTIGSLCDYTVAHARAADIILCATGGEQMTVTSRRAGINNMVMHAGRPALLVPSPSPSSRSTTRSSLGRTRQRPGGRSPTSYRCSNWRARLPY